MSAREDALREMTHGHLYLDDERASALLDAYGAEVLRDAAEKIRLHKDEARGAVQATKVVDFCADLIDPDTP